MTSTPTSVSTPPGGAPGAPIRLGTRGSALAMTQSGTVARRIEELTGRPVELVRIRTEGDVKTGSLASLGGTGVFVTALREALLDGRCDVAVHSLKDLPTAPHPELTYVTPEREDARDALCARDGLTLATLPTGARVGTGSPRRAAQVRAARPDLEVVDIRGNVGTRLDRALGPEADLDAVVLATAGLKRVGRTDVISQYIPIETMTPAPGQGALAVEVRTADVVRGPAGTVPDPGLADALADLDHPATRLAVLAERSVLARLEAGCAAPVGAYAVLADGELRLRSVVAAVSGAGRIVRNLSADLGPYAVGDRACADPGLDEIAEELGVRLAETLLQAGADELAPLGTPVTVAAGTSSSGPGSSGPRSSGPGLGGGAATEGE
ncbi:hydroxymethylbilane synthase [Myceligenerans pegani]|uniref:Porphobilinogen deaminase n=1 Tax=Myceligenerans pegani TaxID=2776917 RepID=A0ABR9N2W2_9MICO|nr:hydroxymethylbilane synthase [Myceligenerans sp. TRM 65318]MBE1877995.1 hydroxymethylbilane synthase [Myceligenerans sp. TRM 65318]MBE3020266.1 hydroxymethylbilane synthase [Myceligenerans sp. TRM 65318]